MNTFKQILCFAGFVSLVFAQIQIQSQIRIGIHGSVGGGGLCSFGDQHDQIMTQLNNPTQIYYSYANANAMVASWVGSTQIDTLAKLQASFDVILLFGSGQGAEINSLSATAAAALVTWVQAGGAVIMGADTVRSLTDSSIYSAIQPIVPITLGSTALYCVVGNNPTWTIYSPNHAILDGILSTSWSPGTYMSWSAPYNGGFTTIATVSGSGCNGGSNGTGLAYKENIGSGAGRAIYMSLPYCGTITYNGGSLRSGSGNQVLHQAIAWGAKASQLCSSYCQNGGVCIGLNNCSCAAGWQGATCTVPKCTNNCNGHGNCTAPNLCQCSNGYTGSTCLTAVCSPPCQNSGNCTAPNTCSCQPGFNGTFCGNSICSPACYNGGNCAGNPNVCNCPPLSSGIGWSGPQCLTPNCVPCLNGGTCQTPPSCNCSGTNYTGIDCSQFDCDDIGGCKNGGYCIGKNKCNCTGTGWNGTTCNNPICTSPCQNGGTCVLANTCDCSSTGRSGPTCTTVSCSPACQNNGTCLPFNQCNCTGLTYGGTRCTDPLCPNITCLNGGICGPLPGQCNCAYTSGLWVGSTCATPTCYPSCKHAGVCVSPNNCNCTGTGYNGTDCSDPIIVPAPPTPGPPPPSSYQEWLPIGLGDIGGSGVGWDTIIAVLIGGCLLCLLCCGVGACLSIAGAKKGANKQTKRADLELF